MEDRMTTNGLAQAADDRMTTNDLAEAMEERGVFYRFLSNALLHEFTVEQIEQLKAMEAPQLDSDEARESLAAAKRYLAHAGADPRTDLAVDYARVFLSAGVYDGLTAEPYESVFTSDEKIMMQDARDDVVAIYRANGVDIDPELRMPEDHLGLELEFVAIMAGKTADALRGEDTAADLPEAARCVRVQSDFLQRHILNWIDDLTQKVDEFAKLPLYPAIMRLMKAYAQFDVQLLSEVGEALSEAEEARTEAEEAHAEAEEERSEMEEAPSAEAGA